MPHDKGINHVYLHHTNPVNFAANALVLLRGPLWNLPGTVPPFRRGKVKHAHFGMARLETRTRKHVCLSNTAHMFLQSGQDF